MRHYSKDSITLVLVSLLLSAASASAQILVPTEQVEKILIIRDVTVSENRLLGEITNSSPLRVRDISLMVQQIWRWKDALIPKMEAPLNAFLLTLKKDLLPGETVTFSSAVSVPETDRADGHFVTDVSVAAFTMVVPEEPAQFMSVQY